MAEVIPQINIDGTKIKNTWTEKEYVTDEVYNALNKAVIDLKNNNNLLDSTSILFREEYNSSSKNLNNAIHQGVYSFTSSAVNAPSGVNGGNLLVTNTSKTNQGSSIITQIAFCHNGAVYARTKNTIENFTAWNKLAYITDNVASATKATQDSQGQQINTTYVKGLSANNATLTVTKGNGSTSTITVNNVSRAECSDRVGANAGYSNNTEASGLKGGLSQSAIYDNGFPFAHGNLISVKNSGANQIALEWSGTTGAVGMVAVRNAGDVGIDTWSAWRYLAYTESPAFSGTPTAPTPSTIDNSTKIATTAYVKNNITETLKKIYPVGSIYMSTVSTNPATLFGFGTWEAMPAGRVLLAQGKSDWGTTYEAGSTGGEATHQLTVGEIPSHNHTGSINTAGEHTHSLNVVDDERKAGNYAAGGASFQNGTATTNSSGNHTHTVTINSTGSGQPHNNLQPYIAVYMWKRIA